ncbi:hypothetical protein MSPP1_001574 [Malassezia sp. CBS 17886]|nr:hypothetical protein MSPP1_001574 [Malassezia sp. CBS 17886]
MGTGISSILLYELPYQFRGLDIIAEVIFALNVFLFLLFTCISIARYTIWPQLIILMLHHSSQSMFIGTFSMALTTIVDMCAYALAGPWGPRMVTFTWVLWWINAAIAFIICSAISVVQFTRNTHSHGSITGLWLLTVITTVVVASAGGIVADTLGNPSHARLTVIVSYVLWGCGFPLAMIILVMFYSRLSIYKVPSERLIVTILLPLGPLGQGLFGLLQFSAVVTKLSKESGAAFGGPYTPEDARVIALGLHAVTVPIVLVMWGLAFVWFTMSCMILLDMWSVSELAFNMGWWGFTFPIGVFAAGTCLLGKQLDSHAFKIIGTIFSVFEVILWLAMSVMTLKGAINGSV